MRGNAGQNRNEAMTRRLQKKDRPGNKFAKVMGEQASGTLRSSSGAVPGEKQARAIAFSEQRRADGTNAQPKAIGRGGINARRQNRV